jgi:NADH-quinone oxidoreductase subunit N
MNELELQALLPFMVLAASSLVVILLIAFRLSHTVIQVSGFMMMCLTVICMWLVRDTLPREIPPLLVIDGFAAFTTGLIVFVVLAVGLFSYIYFEEREENPKEYYILLFLATLGAAVLTVSKHFISLFIGLEILSISLYGLIGYLRNRNNAVEAGLKYLMLAALTSAFLLFGMALVYLETGSMDFAVIGRHVQSSGFSVLMILGIGILLVAVGFKLAFVPFHLWAADVYQGAPPPVTAFIATASKIGVFSVLLRFGQSLGLQNEQLLQGIFSFIAIASMIVGNLLALRQQNIKRLLAYSSIAHFGYLLVAFLPGNDNGETAALFYLLSYSVTLLCAFGIITIMSGTKHDAESVSFYQGLFWKQPILAVVLSVAMLSLAGIPLTAGFPAKFMVLASGVEDSRWIPVLVLVATSVIGLYYYLRVIGILFEKPEEEAAATKVLHPFFYYATYTSLTVLMLAICWLGLFPGNVIDGIRQLLQLE